MPYRNNQLIANLLSKSYAASYRLLPAGGMVVITADGRRLTFTPAEVAEIQLIPPSLPRIEQRPAQEIIIQPVIVEKPKRKSKSSLSASTFHPSPKAKP